ncbi:MAG: hypothetical protein CR974_02000 [Gammaproteobacteria bacterium]|nr:MAG: hypothetical protein CR974_02000 [Gammaproteobacteria bacterium]
MAEKLDSQTLPLAFVKKAGTFASDQLPLSFAHASGNDNGGEPASKKISHCLWVSNSAVSTLSHDVAHRNRAVPVARCLRQDYGITMTVVSCQRGDSAHFIALSQCHTGGNQRPVSLLSCQAGDFSKMRRLANDAHSDTSIAVALKSCVAGVLQAIKSVKSCGRANTPPPQALSTDISDSSAIKTLASCTRSDNTPVMRVPCEWYEIELPEPEPEYQPPCKPPPPSDRLPLIFAHKVIDTPSDMLPLPFACAFIPTSQRKKTYMIYHRVSAEIDGQPIGIYSAQISTSMDNFCWQFSVDVAHDDFDKLYLDTREDEALLTITINDHQWVMLVEDYNERKAFNFDGYTLTGRSRTALLSGDYAKRKDYVVEAGMYVSQLAQLQLQGLPFNLVYDSDADWYVPANTYAVSGTPIEAIIDIANAGGHYVESHPTEPTLIIKKRWPMPAWEMAGAEPEHQISPLVWTELSAQKRVSTRYNSVRLAGDSAEGGRICRNINAGEPTPEAPLQSHGLYASNADNKPVAAWRNKGIEILSNSGRHKIYTLKQLWADDAENPENIVLAKLGDRPEILDISKSLGKGRVTGNTVNVEEENGATVVTQSPLIDVYLDQ